jgi:hypothetical protein
VTTHPARRLWQVLEPLHDVIYFAPGVRETGLALGLKGFWDTYFAFRAAPLGAATSGVVTASFANFAPRMVERAVPGCWTRTTPEACVATRARASAAALRALGVDEVTCAQATEALAPAVRGADSTGRPLFAANAALQEPTDPVEALWQTTTTLREHRGDGHVAALVTHGITGLQAHVLQSARGRFSREQILRVRGWTELEWDAATEQLRARDLVHQDQLTARGESLIEEVEQRTDELAWSAALIHLGRPGVEQVVGLLSPYALAVHRSGILPDHNPTGLTLG